MVFGRKKKILQLTLLGDDEILYQGPLEEVPLEEEEVIAGSVRFFNDPDPCYIHRGAVRVRFTAEIEEALKAEPQNLDLLMRYTGCTALTAARLDLV